MTTSLLQKARARRLEALASLTSRHDNVIPFNQAARRDPRKVEVTFASSRRSAEPLRLAA